MTRVDKLQRVSCDKASKKVFAEILKIFIEKLAFLLILKHSRKFPFFEEEIRKIFNFECWRQYLHLPMHSSNRSTARSSTETVSCDYCQCEEHNMIIGAHHPLATPFLHPSYSVSRVSSNWNFSCLQPRNFHRHPDISLPYRNLLSESVRCCWDPMELSTESCRPSHLDGLYHESEWIRELRALEAGISGWSIWRRFERNWGDAEREDPDCNSFASLKINRF